MIGPLINSYFKTERANVHLDELKAALKAFMDSDPCSVSVQDDTERRVTIYRGVFKQPHVGIYLIAGDVFQCLRTALDQAVWDLASRTFPDPYWTQFPIFDTNDTETQKKFSKYTRGVPAKAVELIEWLQPYHRHQGVPASDNPLWQLNEINRIDKHRRISVRATAARIETPPIASLEAIENGCEVALPLDAERAFKPEFTPIVVFGDRASGISLQIDGIERIHGLVRNFILPRLAGCT